MREITAAFSCEHGHEGSEATGSDGADKHDRLARIRDPAGAYPYSRQMIHMILFASSAGA